MNTHIPGTTYSILVLHMEYRQYIITPHSRAECPSPLGMSVQLGNNDGGHIHLVFERLGLGLTRLSYRGIHHKHNIVWLLHDWEDGQSLRLECLYIGYIVGIVFAGKQEFTTPMNYLGVVWE